MIEVDICIDKQIEIEFCAKYLTLHNMEAQVG